MNELIAAQKIARWETVSASRGIGVSERRSPGNVFCRMRRNGKRSRYSDIPTFLCSA
jgi:hypothetical protein